MRPISLHQTDLKQLCNPVRADVLVHAYREIDAFFRKFEINPDYRLNIILSDYPDIVSTPFEHRPYTEPCNDMEEYFRANLYHLMNQVEGLLSDFKHEKFHNTENAFVYIFTKPISILSGRISSSLKILPISCFLHTARYLMYYRIFYHYVSHVKLQAAHSVTIDNKEFKYLAKVLAYILTNRFIEKNHEMELWNKIKTKCFKKMPVMLMQNISDEDLVSAYLYCSNNGQFTISELLKHLNISEFSLFELQQ